MDVRNGPVAARCRASGSSLLPPVDFGLNIVPEQVHPITKNMKTFTGMILAGLLLAAAPVARAEHDAPLPTVEGLLERVLENVDRELANEKVFKQNYRFTRTKVREFLDSDGDVKKTESKMRTNDPLRVVVAKKPKSSKVLPANRPMSKAEEEIRKQEYQKADFPLGPELLKRFEFTVSGREFVNGRSTVVVDFAPAKGKVPEKDLKDKFINKAAGRVWIDEADAVLTKADLYLTKPVNVVGGLVGAVKTFTFNFTRHRTPEGLWFTRDLAWHLVGREVVVRREIESREEIFDVVRVK
jgi:hypothetical protein